MKVGLHYSFQARPGEPAEPLIEQALQAIEKADADGFSAAVFAEHHFLDDGWLPRPMLLAAAAAARTKHMRVGTDIVVLPLHHPVAVAEEAAVLDILSDGRAVLGVGLGWLPHEFEGFGVPYEQRAVIYDRSLDLVRALLDGQQVSNEEGFYKFRNAAVRPLPRNGRRVPIWVGALTDRAVRRAARRGDAWVMPPGNRLSRLAEQKRLFDQARADAGYPPVTEQPVRREVFVAETDDEAWELFAPGLRHEFGKVYRPLHPDYPDDDTVLALRKWGEGLFPVGSPETVAAEFEALSAACGATEVLVRVQLPYIAAEAIGECLEGLRDVLHAVDAGR